MSATDDVLAAAKELAADLRAHYMLPNTWPTSQRFLRAVEALADQEQTQSEKPVGGQQDEGALRGARAAPSASASASASAPVVPEKPEPQRRAPQT